MAGYFNEGVLVEWDDDRDPALVDSYKVWVCDPKQTTRCFTPFDLWMLQQNYDNHGIPYAHDYFSSRLLQSLSTGFTMNSSVGKVRDYHRG